MKKTTLRMTAAALLTAAFVSAATAASTYDTAILADKPVMFLGMDTPASASQSDLSGHGHNGTYMGGAPGKATLPNGETAAVFNGSSQFLTVPAASTLSVPAARALTIESWIKPSVLNFAHTEQEQYVYFLGKGNPSQGYEYANRMYSYTNSAGRPNRISTYDWNTNGGLGSGAYFQDTVTTTQWIHVVDVINMNTGYIDIYKNGALRGHVPLSQYSVTPGTTQSPFNVGTRNGNSFFQGAIGKVAVYGAALTPAQIANHYKAMTTAGTTTTAGGTTTTTGGTTTTTGGTTTTTGGTTATTTSVVSNVKAAVTSSAASISWNTTTNSHSQVEYGPTTAYGTKSYQSTATGMSHSIPLSGLKAGTAYHFRVLSLDSATGKTDVSGDYTFTTTGGAAAPAPTAPVISGVAAASLTQTGATINWTTDKASLSQVEYGLTTSYGSVSAQSTAAGTAHSVALGGLSAGKVYHYRVKSLDTTTNLTGVSADGTFTTAAATTAPATTANTISGVKAAPSGGAATFSWTTTLVSHSQVEYGTTSAYGTLSYQSVATGTSHNLQVTGLKTGVTYHYRVKSLDATGKTAVSVDFTFKA